MSMLVKLEWDSSIAVVHMQDAATENTLSNDLLNGLQSTIEQINLNQTAKGVILLGLEESFCCGNLSSQVDGKSIHQLLLQCELPVIAAMQGDALGDGLILGAYADVIILAEESNYATSYLNQSFTPGSAATYIIPKKFGPLLGAEFLYSSKKYPGHSLKDRNTPIRIVKKANVNSTAHELAKDFSDKLETSLRLLKRHMAQVLSSEMHSYAEQELLAQKI